MKYAIYQMDIIAGRPEENRKKVATWLDDVANREQPDVVVLPEMWTTAYTLPELETNADIAGEPTISFLKELAQKYNVNIIGGSVANKKADGIYNTAIVINRAGELIHQYDKIHLVPMLDEPAYLTGGKEKVKTFTLDGVKMGLIICYDLRFPELARQLALEGVQVLHIVAEWPTPRIDHWKALQVARAIENQMFVVSSNRIGSYNDDSFGGSSMVVDPGGKTLILGSQTQEETLVTELSIDLVDKMRKQVPVFSSRKPDFY
ncbi:putative amidohydrolase [Scopulibacillus darangshiensis]|uniref:Putative amidohydrolase n=1 Tax=Scopulibacillus darangshiensis TaxID=442528 RepID=A0A4R2NI85_9BACL|nr:carbon-nitrogen family hydrolase [Scopulibacillus darangshiensis]TCP21173.1 putative amidohydrolase [Scopulibacillus darangshiensis]